MRYKVVFESEEDGGYGDTRTELVIKVDGQEIARYSDNGEPEDNLFCRDWSWIQNELERAYQLGVTNACESIASWITGRD